jgi:two-component system, response regulator
MSDMSSTSTRYLDLLLVEDNPQDAELTMRVLRRHQLGEHVVWVRDGVDALEYLYGSGDRPPSAPLNAEPRLILLDIKMPRIDGHEVLRRLKADPRSRHIPVVILSSSEAGDDIARTIASGANSFVVKPVSFDEFSETIRHIGNYWLRVNRPLEAS